MQRLRILYVLALIFLFGCQTVTAVTPSPLPTATVPIDTIYFSETPLAGADAIEGIAIVSSPAAISAILNQTKIKILYLDQTSIDAISNETLMLLYQKSVLIASFDTPLSMLTKKAGHNQKMADLELREPRAYISAIVQMKNGNLRTDGEYHDFFYNDFAETHRIMQLQWRMSACTVNIYQASQCAEFK